MFLSKFIQVWESCLFSLRCYRTGMVVASGKRSVLIWWSDVWILLRTMFLLGLIQRTVNVKLTDTWNISFALQVQSCYLSLDRKNIFVCYQSVRLMKRWWNVAIPFSFCGSKEKKDYCFVLFLAIALYGSQLVGQCEGDSPYHWAFLR